MEDNVMSEACISHAAIRRDRQARSEDPFFALDVNGLAARHREWVTRRLRLWEDLGAVRRRIRAELEDSAIGNPRVPIRDKDYVASLQRIDEAQSANRSASAGAA